MSRLKARIVMLSLYWNHYYRLQVLDHLPQCFPTGGHIPLCRGIRGNKVVALSVGMPTPASGRSEKFPSGISGKNLRRKKESSVLSSSSDPAYRPALAEPHGPPKMGRANVPLTPSYS